MKNLKTHLQNFSGNKKLLVIYPHPDDETMASGGILVMAKKFGWKTVVVTLTHGGAGQVYTNLKGKSLKETRAQELNRAVNHLHVDELVLGDFDDGKLRQTSSLWQSWVKKLIDQHNPGIVVTYDHSGVTGHPDHISLSLAILKIIKESKSKVKLFWNTFPKDSLATRYVHDGVRDLTTEPTYVLDLDFLTVFSKWRAAKAHKSQYLGKSLPVPLLLSFMFLHKEWYHEADFSKKYSHRFVEFKI